MIVTESPWGSDSDGEDIKGNVKCAGGLPRPTSKGRQITRTGNSTAVIPPPPTASCIPTLQAYALGCLALHLEDLVEYGDAVLPLLPSEAKAALIAAARRRNELTDITLSLLTDECHSILDVSNCHPRVSMRGVLKAVSCMPNLRQVDLRSLPITPQFLTRLSEACPRIQVLRIGCWTSETAPTTEEIESLGDSLKRILPRLDKELGAAAESWDTVAERNACSEQRLMGLRCLLWPEMPHAVKWHCERDAPAVLINPTSEDVVSRGLPRSCDPSVAVDEALAGEVVGAEKWAAGLEAPQESHSEPAVATAPAVVHIAERFRLAYESREKRLQAVEARRRRKAERQVLAGSHRAGELLIHRWELEL